MQYVPPELREDEGEIEAALNKKLPEGLLTLDDIQGMVHCHTTIQMESIPSKRWLERLKRWV